MNTLVIGSALYFRMPKESTKDNDSKTGASEKDKPTNETSKNKTADKNETDKNK